MALHCNWLNNGIGGGVLIHLNWYGEALKSVESRYRWRRNWLNYGIGDAVIG